MKDTIEFRLFGMKDDEITFEEIKDFVKFMEVKGFKLKFRKKEEFWCIYFEKKRLGILK